MAKKTIDSYFQKENSMEGLVIRMMCKDVCSLSTFCTSSDLRLLFAKSGFQLPISPNTIERSFTEPAQEDIMELEEDRLYDDLEPVKMNLEQEFEMEFKREKGNFNKEKPRDQLDYEMSIDETEGVRSEHLFMVYDYLMTLKPTNVEAERAFSAAGYICNSV
ncbi:hypothetical protein HHI36_024066 [Cryptolaemus montrouzieri]|uniref:HAT C-terminal dimerisation domain-containing protein n=1 Tax=Cryptolaemus montrouzieri TaxID=559131 RepID=A0ABD2N0V3_9CUCU